MKKFSVLVAISVVFLFVLAVDAEEVYVGIGGSYVMESWQDRDDVNSLHVDDSWGLNARLGLQVDPSIFLEAEFNYLPDINWSMCDLVGESRINTYMLRVKYSPLQGDLRPYGVAGGGIMHRKVVATGLDGSFRDTDGCVSAGLGIDWHCTDHVSLGTEAVYIWGLGELRTVEYLNLTAGLAYHF